MSAHDIQDIGQGPALWSLSFMVLDEESGFSLMVFNGTLWPLVATEGCFCEDLGGGGCLGLETLFVIVWWLFVGDLW